MSEPPKASFARLFEIQEKKKIKDQSENSFGGRPPEGWTPTKELVDAHIDAHQNQMVDAHQNQTVDENQTVDAHRKGDRHAKGKVRVSLRYTEAIYNRIKVFCAKNELEIQDLHELAVVEYIDKVDAHQMDGWTPTSGKKWASHDDLMIFKTHDDIIMLYKQFTGRKWSAADDRAAVPFNDVDRRLIELGMIITKIQSRGKRIHSFAYFIPEIRTVTDLHKDNRELDAYLKVYRNRYQKWLAEGNKRE
jgi:hypothetical protein